MKKSRKALLTALSATLAVTLTSGLAITALADEATKDHEFSAKQDVVFEDFDRSDISDTVTAISGVDIGESPYLHVEFDAVTADTAAASRVSQIYKNGSSSLQMVSTNSGKITVRMRAPEGGITFSQLYFGVRGEDHDSDSDVFAKTFAEVVTDAEEDGEISQTWAEYEIEFANVYEDYDVYGESSDSILDKYLLGIHIFAENDLSGVIDIDYVSYEVSAKGYLTEFRGEGLSGDTALTAMAKAADPGAWWAGSEYGEVVKRAVKMTGESSFTVVKEDAVGKYAYAVIEAEGDIDNLKIATTTDGDTWGDEAPYDGYSVNLTGEEKGFKFIYDGEDDVTIKRIYLTNNITQAPASAMPVINAASASVLEDFSVSQSGFTGVWEDMSTAPELEEAGLDYRLSYNNGNKVEVKDGCLVFDCTDLGTDYINYKFKSQTAAQGKYVILKVKGEGGANVDSLRFALGNPEDSYGDIIWIHQMKAAYEYYTPRMTEANPYRTSDGWYYIIADIEESGFGVSADGYSGMDIYFGGTGKLYIDSIFFANEVDKIVSNEYVVQNEAGDGAFTLDFVAQDEGYQYACEVQGLDNLETEYDYLALEIEIAEDTDLSGVRFSFATGTRWASENADGSLYLADGTLLADVGFVAGQAKTVYIDLAKSDITMSNFHIHTNGTGTGSFKINSAKLLTMVRASEQKAMDLENAYTVQNEAGDGAFTLDFVAQDEGYQYACEVQGLDNLETEYDYLALEIEIAEDTDLSGVRFSFATGTRWASENADGSLYLADGTLLADAGFVAGQAMTVYIDLAKSDITMSNFHIHTNGTDTGSFKINSAKLVRMATAPAVYEAYAEQVGLLARYLDNEEPTVSITNSTKATVGDEITIAYAATDNVTATSDLDVVITVTKDGQAVELANNKFIAEEGVYTVTVKVTDENGNEATDVIQITVSAKADDTADGLSGGAIAGIVVGCIAGVALIGGLAFLIIKKKKSAK